MLFGFQKEKDNSPRLTRAEMAFLDKVDLLYMRAFSIKTIRELQSYLTRDCSVKVSQRVHGYGTRYFGSSSFRNTEWIPLKAEGSCVTVQKAVTFDKVRVAGHKCVDVADSYKELWVLDTEQMRVVDICKVEMVV